MVHLNSYKISRNDATTQRDSFPWTLLQAFHCCVNIFFLLCFFSFLSFTSFSQRRDIALNGDWLTSLNTTSEWKKVNIPHNWDDYYGYRRLVHGNLHGDATYKRNFSIKQAKQGKRFFLFFEGVGSYATVYINDKWVGSHAGGRTTFTLDITGAVKTDGSQNSVVVKVAHPPDIKDLPWVCGGCSDERGFSEGSQPMGIFRPVHLIITNDIRVEPFGIHAWAGINNGVIRLKIDAAVKNYSRKKRNIRVVHLLVDALGNSVTSAETRKEFEAYDSLTLSSNIRMDQYPYIKLWSVENPYLYKIETTIMEDNRVIDKVTTDFGFRTISWRTASGQFLLNGKPVFINGIGEYEHLLGQSHAFSNEQISTRVKWLQAAGFNAFRDAHQPHNLLYGQLCDKLGILWWTQFSAHIWYDSPGFRNNFKQLLKEWVIERRNDPALVLWGLQNESKLPEDFAKECTELIRSLDPTASSQRLVTTCNGGSGTDWDVPQNWTGTYGGDPDTYASDIKKQKLIGEYGAWRTIDLHTEGGFVQNGILSEDRMTQLMEQKILLAESVKDSCAGQFFWLLTSHDNPGRVQGGEGWRELDRIGPVNYKGLLTPWEEPTDAFYMFRSHYASKVKEPMIYIVSHTWPNRWMQPGIKDGIVVYSNCDEVELFNDIDNASLGKRKRDSQSGHFRWDKADIRYNILYAIGYINGKAVAKDTIVLNHLPPSPQFNRLYAGAENITKPQPGYNYLYRINCGGPEYEDQNGNTWEADKTFSRSWSDDFPGMPAFFASQRRTFSPIKATKDWKLFQTFRYGKDKLKFEFPLPDGEYLVELYFIEPWIGIGGGFNGKTMRLFDVAINDRVVLHDLDIWSEAGTNKALKKIVKARISGGKMVISFPGTKAGQALISAIAIATNRPYENVVVTGEGLIWQEWMDIGDKQYADENIRFNSLPPALFGAEWIQFNNHNMSRKITLQWDDRTDLYIAVKDINNLKSDLKDFGNIGDKITTDENGGTTYIVLRKRLEANQAIDVNISGGYIVAHQPATTIQPAYDLKPITQYKANVAIMSKDVHKENVQGREAAVIKTNDEVYIEYPIQTGVADIYSITMKYYFSKQTPVKGRLQLIGTGNTMMLDEKVPFTFTNPGKWNQFTINTGNMINAGNYTVRLVIAGAEGLAISGVDVQ